MDNIQGPLFEQFNSLTYQYTHTCEYIGGGYCSADICPVKGVGEALVRRDSDNTKEFHVIHNMIVTDEINPIPAFLSLTSLTTDSLIVLRQRAN